MGRAGEVAGGVFSGVCGGRMLFFQGRDLILLGFASSFTFVTSNAPLPKEKQVPFPKGDRFPSPKRPSQRLVQCPSNAPNTRRSIRDSEGTYL